MNNRWNRFLSLMLALCTVLTMIPAGFALETTEELPQQPEAEAEEVIAEEEAAPVEQEPAAETPVMEETAVSEPIEGVMAAAVIELDKTAGTDYPSLQLTGLGSFTLAEELISKLNAKRAGNGASSLIRVDEAMSAALDMAAEYVLGSNAVRPNGESWLTIAGDHELAVNEGSEPLCAFLTADEADAEAALETLLSAYPTLADSTSYNNVGAACFQRDNGLVYWAVLAFNGPGYESCAAKGELSYSYNVPFTADSLDAALVVEAEDTDLSLGESFTLNAALVTDQDSIVLDASLLTFATSDEKVVSVDETGKVTAAGDGQADVTVTLKAEESITTSIAYTSTLNLTSPVLKSAANQTAGIKITWEAVPGATSYRIYRSTTAGTWKDRLATVAAPGTSYVDKTATVGTTYYYTVRSVHNNGGTDILGTYDKDGLAIIRLATPTVKSATASNNGITVAWNKVNGAANYSVWRKVGTGSWTKIATTSSATYLDTNVKSGTKYTYTIRAHKGSYMSDYNRTGKTATATKTVSLTNYIAWTDVKYRTGAGTSYAAGGTFKAGATVTVYSGWSTTANNTTWYKVLVNGKVYYVMAQYLLATPTLKTPANRSGGVQVGWNKVANATGYTVWRMPEGGSWKKIATITSGNTTSYIDKKEELTSGETYSYTVRATRNSKQSSYNKTGKSLVYVETPELISAKADTSSITFTWKAAEGVDGYTVWRKVNNGSWQKVQTLTDPTVTSYKDLDVTSLTEYAYTVRAQLGKNQSHYDTKGVADMIVLAGSFENAVVTSATKYRTGAGTSYSSDGSLKAGAMVSVLSEDLKSTTTSWCRILITNTKGSFLRYIPKSAILTSPALKKVSIVQSGIKVEWPAISGATQYEVWRKANDGSWKQMAVVTGTNYTDTSVSTGTKYTYTLRATVNGVRSSYNSTGTSIIYLATPSLTSAIACKVGSKYGIQVRWGAVDGADGYVIYRRAAGATSWARLGTTANLNFFDSSSMVKDVTYYYTVRAYKGSYMSYYDKTGIGCKAQVTQVADSDTVKYTVTSATPYYELINGQVLGAGQKGTLAKGDTIRVIPSMDVVEDGYSEGVTYTPFLQDGKIYYVLTARIKKV